MFNVRRVSRVQRGEFSLQGSQSSVQSLVSRVQCPESIVESPASRFQHPDSSVQSPASKVQRPKSGVQSPESSVQSPPSRVQRLESSVQSPASNSCVHSPRIPVCHYLETFNKQKLPLFDKSLTTLEFLNQTML